MEAIISINSQTISINSPTKAIITREEVMAEVMAEVVVVNFGLYVKFAAKQVIWLHIVIFILIIILLFQTLPTAHNMVTTMAMHLRILQVHIQLMIHLGMLIVVLQITSLLT